MKLLIYISLSILTTTFSLAQSEVGYLFEELPFDTLTKANLRAHTSLKPVIRMSSDSSKNYFNVGALADLNYAQQIHAEAKTGLGIELTTSINNKWYARLSAVQGISNFTGKITPKAYYNKAVQNSANYLYTDIRSRISYTPNHIFNFQAGLDHNFIGEGSRSMFLSDYGKPYPFALIRANFWRLEYSVLYQFMHEFNGIKNEGKFMSSHHISFNASKSINFGLFETVVFQPKDTLLRRGFDVEYLNPLVFYRPQEYALGSSDNVLIGFDASVKWKSHTFYGQVIVDEFDLPQLRAKTGYWANKFGGQFGAKGRFGSNKEFFYRVEYNFARPYTYSHVTEELAYGNQGTNLAHPYGANFMEILGELKYQKKKLTLKLFMNYYLTGDNTNGFFYGANVYDSYVNRPDDYGFYIGIGRQRNASNTILTASYRLFKHNSMSVFGEIHVKNTVQSKQTNSLLVIGVRSLLWNDYRNY
jgi:hypothetical protein